MADKLPGASLPATFVNRFYIAARPSDVRFVFGEKLNDDETMHIALVMSQADAIELRDVLVRMFGENEAPAGTVHGSSRH